MRYQNEYEQAKYIRNKSKNMFEQYYHPTPKKRERKRLQQSTEEKEPERDICGLRKQISANAAYIFPTTVAKHITDRGNAKEIFDIVVGKEDEKYQALLYVRDDKLPNLVGGHRHTVVAALESLLEISCEKVGLFVDAMMAPESY